MTVHVFLYLLVYVLLLCLVLLWRHGLLPLQPSHEPAGSRHTLVHRLHRPRTPLDCPICCLCSSDVRPAPEPVRPWGEVKSRREPPKRVNIDGFACPNLQCPYAGITDAQIHALARMARMARPSASRRFAVRPATPPSVLDIVLARVAQHESYRTIAKDYHVSRETIRRLVQASKMAS